MQQQKISFLSVLFVFVAVIGMTTMNPNNNHWWYVQAAAEEEATTTKKKANDFSSPWFGAIPPKKKYRLQRLQQQQQQGDQEEEEEGRYGESERLGAVIEVGNVSDLDDEGVAELFDAVRAHGMIIIKGQNLTRSEQVAFTAKFGPVIVLPSSFEGKDVEPGQPAIQRITNFWANGTWKGPSNKFGSYWHQDGQFWTSPKQNLLSVIHARQVVSSGGGGQTGFADLRAARLALSPKWLDLASNATIHASVRRIQDFANGKEEDYARFPDSTHRILSHHGLDGGPMLYPGSPHMIVGGLPSSSSSSSNNNENKEEVVTTTGSQLLSYLFEHATLPSFTYYHRWEVGDVVIWDNTQTLHRAMSYNNDGVINRREMYRTQCRFVKTTTDEEDDRDIFSSSYGDVVQHDEL